MGQKEIIYNKITSSLESIIEQTTHILNSDRIPQIDIDLTLAQIRVLYDSYLDLDKYNQTTPAITKQPEPTIKQEIAPQKIEPVIIEEETPIIPKPIIEKIIEPEPVMQKKEEPKPAPTKQSTDLFSTAETATVTNPDKIKTLVFENTEDKSMATKMQKAAITSIKGVIGINERYQFMNTLFKGNADHYNHAINSIDTCTNKQEAISIIDQLQTKYNWQNQNETDSLSKLNELIDRRFQA